MLSGSFENKSKAYFCLDKTVTSTVKSLLYNKEVILKNKKSIDFFPVDAKQNEIKIWTE